MKKSCECDTEREKNERFSTKAKVLGLCWDTTSDSRSLWLDFDGLSDAIDKSKIVKALILKTIFWTENKTEERKNILGVLLRA